MTCVNYLEEFMYLCMMEVNCFLMAVLKKKNLSYDKQLQMSNVCTVIHLFAILSLNC